jgi:hypothetical protein
MRCGVLVDWKCSGVAPVGLLTAMPFIIDSCISPTTVWLGGGEEDVKLLLFLDQLVLVTQAYRANLTGPVQDD